MGLRKLKESVDGLDVVIPVNDDTHPVFQKECDETQGDLASLTLHCYVYENGRWQYSDYSPQKKLVKIGANRQYSDITIKDKPEIEDVQVILRLLHDHWFIIENGRENLTKVNGIARRQTSLAANSSCVMEIAGTPIVITTKGENFKEPAVVGNKSFTLETPNDAHIFPFQKCVLIGSDSSCDIHTQGAEFAAVISPLGKKLYIHSFGKDRVFLDGKVIEHANPLNHGAMVSIHYFEIKLLLPKEYQNSVGFSVIPNFVNSRLCFLELLDEDRGGTKFILPSSGRSIFIGRAKESYFRVDNPKISRKHAQAIIYDDSVLLLDCYSTNGTFVNHQKVGKKMVHPGDIMEFGTQKFMLCYAE